MLPMLLALTLQVIRNTYFVLLTIICETLVLESIFFPVDIINDSVLLMPDLSFLFSTMFIPPER